MVKFFKFTCVILVMSLSLLGTMVGCTKKPSAEETGKLEEAKAAAESAERKLSELRIERMQLEKDLEGAKSEEQEEKQELEGVQSGEE